MLRFQLLLELTLPLKEESGKRLGKKWGEKVAVGAVHRAGTAFCLHELSERPRVGEGKIALNSLLDVKSSHLAGCE